MTGLTFSLIVSIVLLVTWLQLPALQTLPVPESVVFLTAVTVIVSRTTTRTTRPMTRLAILTLPVQEETRLTVVHTLSVEHIEAVLTPVALRLVTVDAVFIFTF